MSRVPNIPSLSLDFHRLSVGGGEEDRAAAARLRNQPDADAVGASSGGLHHSIAGKGEDRDIAVSQLIQQPGVDEVGASSTQQAERALQLSLGSLSYTEAIRGEEGVGGITPRSDSASSYSRDGSPSSWLAEAPLSSRDGSLPSVTPRKVDFAVGADGLNSVKSVSAMHDQTALQGLVSLVESAAQYLLHIAQSQSYSMTGLSMNHALVLFKKESRAGRGGMFEATNEWKETFRAMQCLLAIPHALPDLLTSRHSSELEAQLQKAHESLARALLGAPVITKYFAYQGKELLPLKHCSVAPGSEDAAELLQLEINPTLRATILKVEEVLLLTLDRKSKAALLQVVRSQKTDPIAVGLSDLLGKIEGQCFPELEKKILQVTSELKASSEGAAPASTSGERPHE